MGAERESIGYFWNFKNKQLILVQTPVYWRESSRRMRGFGKEQSIEVFRRAMSDDEQEEYNQQWRMRCFIYKDQQTLSHDELEYKVNINDPAYQNALSAYIKQMNKLPVLELFEKTENE